MTLTSKNLKLNRLQRSYSRKFEIKFCHPRFNKKIPFISLEDIELAKLSFIPNKDKVTFTQE